MISRLFSKGSTSCEEKGENQFSFIEITQGETPIVAHHSWDLGDEESNQHSKDSAASCTREEFFLTSTENSEIAN